MLIVHVTAECERVHRTHTSRILVARRFHRRCTNNMFDNTFN